MKLNALALGYTGAIVSAACMLLLGTFGSFGMYSGAMMQMAKWHMFFSPTIGGTVAGMVEAAIIGFIALYAFGAIYNWILDKQK